MSDEVTLPTDLAGLLDVIGRLKPEDSAWWKRVIVLEGIDPETRRLVWLYAAQKYLSFLRRKNVRQPQAAAAVAFFAWKVVLNRRVSDSYDRLAASIALHIEESYGETLTPFCSSLLSDFYRYGWGTTKNRRRAFSLTKAAAADAANGLSRLNAARDYLSGSGVKQDYAKALEYFRNVATTESESAASGLLECMVLVQGDPPNNLTFIDAYERLATVRSWYRLPYLIRLCLGIGCAPDPTRALAFHRRFPDGQEGPFIQVLLESGMQVFAAADAAAIAFRQELISGSRPKFRRPLFRRSTRSGHLEHFVAAIAWVAVREENQQALAWFELMMRYACFRYNFKYREVFQASVDVGPVFNKVSARGITEAEWPNPGPRLAMPDNDSIAVLSFHGKILAVIPDFSSHRRVYHPKLFSFRDILIILALAFGAGPKPVMPSFSLDDYKPDPAERALFGLRKKVFNPSFLGATSIGKSMYWADAVMPTFGPGNLFSLSTYFENGDWEANHHDSWFYRAVDDVSGVAKPRNAYNSQAIEFVNAHVDPSTNGSMFGFRLERFVMRRIDMRFQARTYTIDDKGKVTTLSTNDPETLNGRHAAVGTNNFEAIARAFPAFARVRMFLALCRLFATLRSEQRYVLCPPLQWAIEKTIRFYSWRSHPDEPVLRSFVWGPREGVMMK